MFKKRKIHEGGKRKAVELESDKTKDEPKQVDSDLGADRPSEAVVASGRDPEEKPSAKVGSKEQLSVFKTKNDALDEKEPEDSGSSKDGQDVENTSKSLQEGAYTGNKEKRGRFGPLVAASNIRSSMAIDFQQDICKDYKQTGYCGYGDNCKFLHIRENYASSWQIDQEHEKKLKASETKNDETVAVDVKIPSTCPICDQSYQAPVITKCGHYFCEKCFITRAGKTKTCAVCGKGTGGRAKPTRIPSS